MIENLAEGISGFTSNVHLVTGERNVLVDVGDDFDVVSAIRARVEDLDAVVLTHTHPDHVGNLDALRGAFDAPVAAFDATRDDVDEPIADGDTVGMGDHEYVAIHTPGHAEDHLCLHSAEAGVCFVGDLVFDGGGFGRTDFPGADRTTLIESLDRVLRTVDPDLRAFYAGHGPAVTEDPYGTIELARRLAASR